jgi:uncharacterized integral membrane protein (TIGR00698 family)
VHDVGQVVAASQPAGPDALHSAVVVKLMRVLMLAPLVAGVALAYRSRKAPVADGGRRPALVPLFVVGFIAMVVVRSTGLLPQSALDAVAEVREPLMAAALVGLGSAVDLRRLIRTGGRALLTGLLSWLLIGAAAYGGVLLAA